MKHVRLIAAALLASFLLFQAGAAAAARPMGDPPVAGGGPVLPPDVTVEEQGKGDPAQSLGDALGLAPVTEGRKGLVGGPDVFTASADFVMTGNACLEAGASLHLAGHRLTVYGDFTISGNIYLEKGSVIVSGNLIVDSGLLVMTNSLDYVQAGGSMIANGRNHTNCLTAGRLKVFGDFLQEDDYSVYSWNTSGTHVDEFAGAGKLIQFHSPQGSAFANPVFLTGTSFTAGSKAITVKLTYVDAGGDTRAVTKVYNTTGGTFLSISNTLTADYAIAAPNLYYMGAQGNWKLTVNNGNLIVPPGTSRSFTGSVSANNVYVAGSLTLATPGKSVTASGLFGVYGSLQLTAGSVVTARFEAGSFAAEGVGTPVTVNCYSADDMQLTAATARCSGSLAGRRLDVLGGLEVPAGQALDVGGGRIDVSGGMTVSGALDMHTHADTVVVGGKFTACGESSDGHLTDGYLALAGDFEQSGDPASFKATGAHCTLLCGTGSQSVSFADPAGSSFANLYVMNPAVTDDVMAGLPCAGERVRTGTALSGIGVDGGGSLPLYPPFGGGLSYECAVPRDISTVTISPQFTFPNQTAVLYSGGSALPGMQADVPQGGHGDVTVEALSAAGQPYAGAGAPFSTTCELVLQPQNPELSSAGMAYTADKPFDRDTTDYAVTVPVKDENFTFAPRFANPNASLKFVCGGVETAGPSFSHGIGMGETVEADAVVTAYGNPSSPTPVTETYRFMFRRQTLLDGFSLSSGSLNEPFGADTYSYTADVPASVWSVTVTPTLGDGCSSCKAGGIPAVSSELLPPAGGSATAEFTLADGTGAFVMVYRVTVRRAPLLNSIAVRSTTGLNSVDAVLSPAFASANRIYEAFVPVNCDSVTVAANPEPGCTGLTVGGLPGECHPDIAPGGCADVAITASAGDADQQKATWTVKVSKPLLKGLAASAGAFDKPFSVDPAIASRIVLPYAIPSVTLTPSANDGGAGQVTVSYWEKGVEIAGPGASTFALAQGQTRNIVVRAQYPAVDPVDYAVTLYRGISGNADLSSIGASAGWLSAAFSPAVTSYTLVLPETISAVTFRPVVAEPNSTFRIDTLGWNVAKTVKVSLYGTATVRITVKALNGNTRLYTVYVRRKPMLASVSASPVYRGYPPLSPGGTDRLSFNYSVSLPATMKLEIYKSGRWYAVLSRAETSSGAKSFSWDGAVAGKFLASGYYSARLTPYWAGKAGTSKRLTVKILPRPVVTIPSLTPASFAANGSNRLTASVKWTQFCNVRVDVVDGAGTVVRILYSASNLAPTTRTVTWDGKNASGALMTAGAYRIKLTCGGSGPVYRAFTVK